MNEAYETLDWKIDEVDGEYGLCILHDVSDTTCLFQTRDALIEMLEALDEAEEKLEEEASDEIDLNVGEL